MSEIVALKVGDIDFQVGVIQAGWLQLCGRPLSGPSKQEVDGASAHGRYGTHHFKLLAPHVDHTRLIHPIPVGERTAVVVQVNLVTFLIEAIRAEVGETALNHGLVFFGRAAQAIARSELGQRDSFCRTRTKCPSPSYTTMPFGCEPKGSNLLPSWSTYWVTGIHVPMIC